MPSTPRLADWVAHALEERRAALARIDGCASARCMCRAENDGAHQAPDCHCYRDHHDMIEVTKINTQFATAVARAFGGEE